MPFPGEHAARIRRPGEIEEGSFRRTAGGRTITVQEERRIDPEGPGSIEVPESMAIIWGRLEGEDEFVVAQSLRFPTGEWTAEAAEEWLADNNVKPLLFEPAEDTAEAGWDAPDLAALNPFALDAAIEAHQGARLASLLGTWAIAPRYAQSLTAGPQALLEEDPGPRSRDGRSFPVVGSVAVVPINGPMMKSAFFGSSTLEARRQIRAAALDDDVSAILLLIDSPGGMVAGTSELAADVRAANGVKPVVAHIDDLGASAAFWVASQASLITANATAEVGSIGTFAIVEDTSALFEAAGIKVHVISTGPFKGSFADGAPITEEQLEALRVEIEDLNAHFQTAVRRGRGMTAAQLKQVSDGRVFIADKAKALGLIDRVASLDDTLGRLQTKRAARGPSRARRAAAAERLARLD
jgi:signal peptide peptidase SppA